MDKNPPASAEETVATPGLGRFHMPWSSYRYGRKRRRAKEPLLLMKVKEESGKAGLRVKIQKTKITASSPITSWQIDGETVETVTDFTLGTPKSLQMLTVAMKLKDACSLEETL